MKKKILLLKGCAGLGNRIYSLIQAVEYAKRTNRLLIIDWGDGLYFERGYNFFSDYFNLIDVDYESLHPHEIQLRWCNINDIIPKTFKDNLAASIYDKHVQVSNRLVERFAFKFLNKSKLKGYWLSKDHYANKQQLSAISFIRNSLRPDSLHLGANLPNSISSQVLIFADYVPLFDVASFKKHFRISEDFRVLIEKYASKYGIKNCVGVHVRATDMLPTKSVEIVINTILRNYTETPVFLATDDQSVEMQFREVFSDLRTHLKEPTPKGIGIHQLASKTNDFSKAKANFENSLLDMYLLSMTSVLYFQGNSSFSRLAAALQNGATIDWLESEV